MCIRLFDVASKERRKQNTALRREHKNAWGWRTPNPRNSILLLLLLSLLLLLLLLLLLHLRLSCLLIWNSKRSKRSITPMLLSLYMPSRYMGHVGRAIAPVSLNFGARWVWVVGSTPPPLYCSSLQKLYGPRRTLASFRINLQASLNLVIFFSPSLEQPFSSDRFQHRPTTSCLVLQRIFFLLGYS